VPDAFPRFQALPQPVELGRHALQPGEAVREQPGVEREEQPERAARERAMWAPVTKGIQLD